MAQAGRLRDVPRINSEAFAHALRSALFFLFFFLFWITVTPFQNSDTVVAGTIEQSNLLNQVCLVFAAWASALFTVQNDWRLPKRMFSLPFLATFAVLTCASFASPDPGNSLKHIVLTALVIIVAAGTLLVPVSQAHFRSLLTAGAVSVLVICYLGVLLYPSAAIHHGGDSINELHDGGWRGLFRHKNQAGAAMALLVFIGLFVARESDRRQRRLVGWCIVVGAGFFLLQTGSKTPIALVILVIGFTWALQVLNHTALRLAAVVLVLSVLGLLTVGSANIDRVGEWTRAVLPDPTFTQRTDIWSFAGARVMEAPWFGQGFREFWGTPKLVFAGYGVETWAHMATDGHNGYLDIALLAGIPALIVSLGWLVVQPVFDMKRAERGDNASLTTLFVQLWLYCLVAGFFESIFFSGGGPVWFTFVVAVLGLRMNASAALVRS